MFRNWKGFNEPRFGKMTEEQAIFNRHLFPHLHMETTLLRAKTEEELEREYMVLLYDKPMILKGRTRIVMALQSTLAFYENNGDCRHCQENKRVNIIRNLMIDSGIDFLLPDAEELTIAEPKKKRKPRKKKPAPKKTKK